MSRTIRSQPSDESEPQMPLYGGRNVFITGGAGTGKSYLSREIAKKNGHVQVTSSTGISALQVGGVTLHRLLGLGLCEGSPASLAYRMKKRPKLYSMWKNMKTLIIDEISMLDVGLFVRVSEMMKLVRENDRPWGGIQLILVGDFLQLPPVKLYKDEDGTTYKYLFQHPIWKELDLHIINLTESKRTSDKAYFEFLNDVRLGLHTDRVKEMITARSIEPVKRRGIVPTFLISTNKEVDSFNMSMLMKLPPISDTISTHQYTGSFSSNIPDGIIDEDKIMNDVARQCLAPNPLHLRNGAQVMLLVNMPEYELCNGSRGVVIGFNSTNEPIVRFKNGQVLTIEPHCWKSTITIGDDRYWASWTHMPIKLAYAVTIHKSQGLTLDSAIVRLDTCFTPGMMYVALSRCRDPSDMYIVGWSDDSYRRCAPSHEVVNFYRNI